MRIPLFSGLIPFLKKLPLKRRVALTLTICATGVGLLLRLTYRFGGERGTGVLWGILTALLFTLGIVLWKMARTQK